jgi:hypothetical protein
MKRVMSVFHREQRQAASASICHYQLKPICARPPSARTIKGEAPMLKSALPVTASRHQHKNIADFRIIEAEGVEAK